MNYTITCSNGAVIKYVDGWTSYAAKATTYELVSGEWPSFEELLLVADGWRSGYLKDDFAPFGGRKGNPWNENRREIIVHTD